VAMADPKDQEKEPLLHKRGGQMPVYSLEDKQANQADKGWKKTCGADRSRSESDVEAFLHSFSFLGRFMEVDLKERLTLAAHGKAEFTESDMEGYKEAVDLYEKEVMAKIAQKSHANKKDD